MKFVCAGDVAVDDYYQIDRLPKLDEKVNAKFLGRYLGGTTYNTARALHRLDSDLLFVTDIAKDDLGSFIKQELKMDDLETYVVPSKTERTFYTIILLTQSGEKAILLVRGSDQGTADYNLKLSPQELGELEVFFSTNLLPQALGLDKNKVLSVISLEAPDVVRDPSLFQWCLDYAHTVILNQYSFQEIFHQGYSDSSFFNALSSLPKLPEHIIITSGARGSMVFLGRTKKLVISDAYQAQIRDTTGAGDIFNAAYMHAFFTQRMQIEDALSYANAVASASCEVVGADINQGVIEKANKMFLQRKLITG